MAASTNWREVMRALELNPASAGAIRKVKRRALILGCDISHFRGKRTWSDAQLRQAIIQGRSWTDALLALGLTPDSTNGRTRIRAHARRLGLDVAHLEGPVSQPGPPRLRPDLQHLRDAATSLAAAWFMLRGCNAAFPVEPALYDLLVSMPDGIKRVQVKTTTHRGKDGWSAGVGRRPYSIGNRERLIPYDPELIDLFFIMDGDLNIYLLPSQVIAGRVGILLRTYEKYIVGNALGLMTSAPPYAA